MAEMEGTFLANGRLSGRMLNLAFLVESALTHRSGQWLGWTGLIKVDGTTFLWMGAPGGFNNKANQTSFEYTSTKSIFTMTAGKIELKVTFLSPLTPKDYKRQSLTFSYMDVAVSSLDGSEHDVQVYTDISAGNYIFLDFSNGSGLTGQ